MMTFKEYKVLAITEGALGTLFLGASGMPLQKVEATLNKEAANGWQLVFQVIENRRFWLFWSRETVIVTLGR
nr:DUF4177 domain-containing protein [Agarivorans litoreus]